MCDPHTDLREPEAPEKVFVPSHQSVKLKAEPGNASLTTAGRFVHDKSMTRYYYQG